MYKKNRISIYYSQSERASELGAIDLLRADDYLVADIDLRPVSNEIFDYIRITPASGP